MSAILKQKLIDIANGFTKYGLWKGGGSETLSELNDVTLTNSQKNDVLTYNGSEWVNDDNLQTQINTLNNNLNTKITAEYVRNLIIAIGIANNNISNYTIGPNGALFILSRNSAIFIVTYQSDKPIMVFGSLPSGLTISKSKQSSQVTIENKMGYTLNGIILTT